MAWKTDEEYSAQLESLRERIRQHRIERGLPPDPPKKVRKISDELTLTLMDRLDSFVNVTLEIARLYRAGHFVVIDAKRLKQYSKCASLLGRSIGSEGRMTGTHVMLMIAAISSINKQIDEGASVEELSQYSMVTLFYDKVLKFRTELPHSKMYYRYFMKRRDKLDENCW